MFKSFFMGAALLGFGLASFSAKALPASEIIRCDSVSHGYARCDARDIVESARLIRQHSDVACVLGRTWGYDSRGVWVSQGCRASFEVYFRYAPLPPPVEPLPPPPAAYCGRFNATLNVPPSSYAWVSLACPAGCRLNQYGYFGSNMPCNWNLSPVAGTLTCTNTNPYYWSQVPQVFIDCVR